MYVIVIVGFLILSLTIIGECQPRNQPKPPKQNICEYREASTDTVYDFTTLISSSEDHVLRNDDTNETVKFQLCHELKSNCNNAGGYAACLQYGNQSIGIGKYPPEWIGENGSIVFKFTGDECNKDKYYTLTVIMICDYSESDNKPALFPYEKQQCDLFISWKTKLACGGEVKNVNCTVQNSKGDLVDLSSLKSQIDNYVIPRDDKSSIILNVCHSVIPGYRATCLPGSGACLRNESSSNPDYIKLGDVEPPKLINGTVALEYTGGRICNDDHTKTTIFFICDFKPYKTLPVLINTTGCNYQLLWKTVAACSDKELVEYSLKTASPCKINDPVTNLQYDLESLKGQDYVIEGSESSYKISICGPLTSNACKKSDKNAGVCHSPNRTEGQANSKLLWSPGGPYLNYTDGELCDGEKRHYTIISFICTPENDKSVPTIVDNTACFLNIKWPTPLVCKKKNIPCDSLESHACSNDSTNSTSTVPSVIPSPVPSVLPSTVPSVGPTIKPNGTNSGKSMNIYSITSDSTPQSEAPDDGTSTSHGGVIAFVVIFIVFGLLCGVYLANPNRRSNLYTFCSSWFLRRSPTRMSYSQVNSVEETNLLLDAPDTCCQSDSDDDLLRI